MTAARHRLHLHEITSIGACEEGDDPMATIKLWKSRPDKSAKDRPASRGMSMGSSAGRSRAASMKTTEEAQKTIVEIRSMMKGTRMSQTMTAEGIAEAVAKRAKALRTKPEHWDRSEVELRAETWRRTEGLRDAYTDAAKDPDGFAKSRGGEHSAVLSTIRQWTEES